MLKKVFISIVAINFLWVSMFGTAEIAFAKRTQLTSIEIAGLLHMREEEKLAHDVYVFFYAIYGLNIFTNISHSEQHHMDAMKSLLDTYGVADPASQIPGVFIDQNLQALYNELTVRGSQSIGEAIKVGGVIEEIDILDLEYYLTNTNKYNIQQVYGNLLHGSENHLRAFVSTLLTITDEVYQPQYLSQQRYQEIIAGGGGGGGGGGGCRRCGR